MTKHTFTILFLALLFLNADAQRKKKNVFTPTPTPAELRLNNQNVRATLLENSKITGLPFTNIGPTVMSGRVVDIEVDPKDPTHFYVAYASGGLWETTNNGTSFKPLFDNEIVMSIGDIYIDWTHGERIWVGTGENNSSRSSYSGTGIYKSDDHGKTWTHAGLPDSHHIGRILVHPDKPEVLWAAVLGHLYSPNTARGIYMSIDGGTTWSKQLFVDESTGFVDLVMEPSDPNHMFASSWTKSRSAWNFQESGSGSGIWESTNGGVAWTNISGLDSGFPYGPGTGRIGLAIAANEKGLHLYAALDNQNRRPEEEKQESETTGLERFDFKMMSRAEFLSLDTTELQSFLEGAGFPEKYSAEKVFQLVESKEITPKALFDYGADANQDLFDTPVVGLEIYKWDPTTSRWSRTHEDYLDDVVYTYGYYFGLLRVHPNDPDLLYTGGVPLLKSTDGGKTWTSISEANVHADHHEVWLNPENEKHLINGNDGGVNISYDGGEHYIKCNTPAVGQFYTVAVDDADPYRVYGGLQDNGVWVGPHDYEHSTAWHQSGHYPYESLMGGDGMQVAIDTRTNDVVYTGYQFGHYYKLDRANDEQTYIHPSHDLGEYPLRWNWQTPIHLSRHNQDVVYFGSNKFHRSLDAGESWETLSGDLTKGPRDGDVPFGTLTTIDESPLQFGLIYVGSDDGLIHVSKDGGYHWQRIGETLPGDLWVSRVEASAHKKGRVYVTLNGYRQDHFDAYVYVSEDNGATWTRICTDLPLEPVNVVLEDPANENILYVGTDHGLYISLDRGQTSMLTGNSLPTAPVHDLVIQPRAEDLVVGTHGRSLYRASITELRALNSITEPLYVFAHDGMKHSGRWGESWSKWSDPWEPQILLGAFSAKAGKAQIHLYLNDERLNTMECELVKGLNYIEVEPILAADRKDIVEELLSSEEDQVELKAASNGKIYLPKGTYRIELEKGANRSETKLEIR